MIFAAIADWAATESLSVAFMCEQLGVSRSGYYTWVGAQPSRRHRTDVVLLELIRGCFATLDGNPGVRRIHAELAAAGHRVSRKRVWRLMRTAGLQGRHPRAWKRTTVAGEHPVPAPDLVGRDFTAERPNQKWCGDITYIKTWNGWAYLATVIDLYSRRVVGWALDAHMRTSLVTDALRMALTHRSPSPGVIFHSDRGTHAVHVTRIRDVLPKEQYSSIGWQDGRLLRQRRLGILLRDLQERTHPHPPLARPEDLEEANLQLDRGILQPHPTALHPEILDTSRIRTRIQTPLRTRRLNFRPLYREHSTRESGDDPTRNPYSPTNKPYSPRERG